jgi:hypothetical protein
MIPMLLIHNPPDTKYSPRGSFDFKSLDGEFLAGSTTFKTHTASTALIWTTASDHYYKFYFGGGFPSKEILLDFCLQKLKEVGYTMIDPKLAVML